MIVDFSCDIFSCGTRVFVYAFVHVMCLCVYLSMICQRYMLYDDMYSHDNFHNDKPSLTNKSHFQNVTNFVKFFILYVYFIYK